MKGIPRNPVRSSKVSLLTVEEWKTAEMLRPGHQVLRRKYEQYVRESESIALDAPQPPPSSGSAHVGPRNRVHLDGFVYGWPDGQGELTSGWPCCEDSVIPVLPDRFWWFLGCKIRKGALKTKQIVSKWDLHGADIRACLVEGERKRAHFPDNGYGITPLCATKK